MEKTRVTIDFPQDLYKLLLEVKLQATRARLQDKPGIGTVLLTVLSTDEAKAYLLRWANRLKDQGDAIEAEKAARPKSRGGRPLGSKNKKPTKLETIIRNENNV